MAGEYFTADDWTEQDRERCLQRLSKMSDVDLDGFLKSSEYLASPKSASLGEPSHADLMQFQLATEEKERRATERDRKMMLSIANLRPKAAGGRG